MRKLRSDEVERSRILTEACVAIFACRAGLRSGDGRKEWTRNLT